MNGARVPSAILAASGRSDPELPHGANLEEDRAMTAARVRTATVPDGRAFRLMLVVLVAVCGGQAALAQTAVPAGLRTTPQSVDAPMSDLRFTHLTTNDGLSQGYVVDILQDRRGFMWFATRDGLNRYDGYTFVVHKHDPNDPGSLNSNFLQDLMEDEHGNLWVATNTGVSRFNLTTERSNRYLHDPNNPDTLSGASVKSIAEDSRGYLWFGTEDSGLDKLDPRTGTFTHYRNDTDGAFVGRITQVIAGHGGDIWFVGERGLFHLNQQTGRITRPPATTHGLSADSVYEDEAADLWLLTTSPVVGLVRYDRRAERLTSYPLAARAPRAGGVLASTTSGGSLNGLLAADGHKGLWVPSSEGLSYFDRRTERFTHKFHHEDANPHSLDSNAIFSVYQDRGGVLWVGTENAGLNILNFRQGQFFPNRHRAADPNSVSPGRVKAIHQDRDGVVWVGFFPRALDRVNRKTRQTVHYLPGGGDEKTLGAGTNVNSIYRDPSGYLWVGGGGSGLDRVDERTGRFKRYRHDERDPRSVISNNVYTIYGDRRGQMWVGLQGGISRFDPATNSFVNYRPVPENPASLANTVWVIYQDRSGALWAGTWGGVLIRFDEQAKAFVSYTPDSRDPRRLNGGGINTILEDRTGTLWVGTFDGLYRHDRRSGAFARYTEREGLPSSTIRCILEDGLGRLWLSTQKGVSRFDPARGTFRNYDVSDGLQSNEFSTGCFQAEDGEMFFGGSDGFNAFVPENVRDDAYVPPVVITDFSIFNRPVRVGAESVLKKAIPYVESLTLPYADNVFSVEFAALSYANSHKNRYRYRLEGFDPDWNEVDSKHRLATYTNLGPGEYVFRVQGSNSDGVWNEAGAALSILITPPWYRTNAFRAGCVALVLALLGAAYQYRMRQVRHAFARTFEVRVGERTRIARELHDTLLQSFHGLLLRFQTASYLLPDRPEQAKTELNRAIEQAAKAITEGRDAVQGLRTSALEQHDLAMAIRTVGDELAESTSPPRRPEFRVDVEGQPQELRLMVRDEIYKIAAEGLRNAFGHSQASQVEVEIRYDSDQFRMRVRDDGRGIDQGLLAARDIAGHYGLRGMRERAAVIGGTLAVWSEVGAGTELELRLPASAVYTEPARRSWSSRWFKAPPKVKVGDDA
jgi:ligand-binding sensor domain-containing protein/signal transduction histidine kinase